MERVTAHERQVASEARAMTRLEVIGKALSGSINWIEAAVVLGVTARHIRRLRLRYETFGKEGMLDGRRGLRRRRRVSDATIGEVLRLRRELYTDFSIRHLHEHLVERHGIAVSYTFVRDPLQLHGRFCQLYTDRGSHFCRTERAGDVPADEQRGQVTRVLRTLGIEHVRA